MSRKHLQSVTLLEGSRSTEKHKREFRKQNYTKVINSNTADANTENARSVYVTCETVGRL